jgi:Fructose-1,6-bisphosphatase
MAQNSHQTLGEFIIDNQEDFIYSTGELSRLLSSIKLATKIVNYKVNKAGLVNILGEFGNENVQGEKQQKLDVFANDTFIETLSQREVVCGIASEENEEFIEIKTCKNQNNSKYSCFN